MALTGQAKKDYQKQYMKDKRVVRPISELDPDVRPRYYHPIPLSPDEVDIPDHNKAVRDRMVGMSIDEIELEFGDCPVWRRAIG